MDDIVQPSDYRFYKNDKDFNPARNKAIIAQTIAETEKFFNELSEKDRPEMEKRVDIISSYGRYRFNKGTKELRAYLGDKNYKDLIGEKIMNKVRAIDSVNRLGSKKILL